MPLHIPCCYRPPDPPPGVRGKYGHQVATPTRLAENRPSDLSDAATPCVNNPRWVAVFINDLFDLFWLYTVPRNVFDVVVVPFRLQLPKLHDLRLAQRSVAF